MMRKIKCWLGFHDKKVTTLTSLGFVVNNYRMKNIERIIIQCKFCRNILDIDCKIESEEDK